MSRPKISFAVILSALFLGSFAQANDGVISTVDAARAGLRVEWTSQVDVTSRGGAIVDLHLDVNENRSRTFFAIQYGNKREVISEYDLSAFGVPYGTDPTLRNFEPGLRRQVENLIREGASNDAIKEQSGVEEGTTDKIREEIVRRVAEAGEAAKNRQESLQAMLESQGRDVEVTMEKYTLPLSTVYVATSTGYVQALDADTGDSRWSNSVGKSIYQTIGVGASHDHVAVINGSTVYCLAAESGKLLWSQSCRGAVGAPPVVSQNFVYVPLINGRLEAFAISSDGVGSESYVSIGRAMSRPLITDDSVCWATDKGYFTVASNREVRSPGYRLRSEAPIVASGTGKNGRLFVGSTDGFAYGIDESQGSLLWEFSTGQRLKESPIPIGEYVFLITDENMMFKLFAANGVVAPGWSEPIRDVSKFVGASKDKMYVQNSGGQIVVIGQSNGKVINTLQSRSTDLILANYQSDRLYVSNQSGGIQCLREFSSEVPVFHADDEIEQAAMEPKPDENKDKMEGEGEKDPFDTASDPFDNDKKNADEKKEDDDPFGGNSDPFGDDKKSDPFGGSSSDDPFGG